MQMIDIAIVAMSALIPVLLVAKYFLDRANRIL
jgi:hypothetical protein